MLLTLHLPVFLNRTQGTQRGKGACRADLDSVLFMRYR